MKNKLILEKRRDFGEIISDAFQFIKMHIKPIGKAYLTFILPVILIAGIFSFITKSGMLSREQLLSDEGAFTQMFENLGSFVTFIFLCFSVIAITMNACAIQYKNTDSEVVDYASLIKMMKQVTGGQLMAILVQVIMTYGLLLIAAALLLFNGLIGGLAMFVAFFFCIYFYVNYSILPIGFLDQPSSMKDALVRSKNLVDGHWWSTFGIIFVGGLIGGFVSYIFVIPATMIQMIVTLGVMDGAESDTLLYRSLHGIGAMLQLLGQSVSFIYISSVMIIKYYDLVERNDNTNLRARIAKIGTREESFFENEGEF